MEERIIRDIKNLLEREKQDHYKPVIVCGFYRNNCIKYQSNGDRNKTLSIKKYFDVVKPYLKDIMNNLKKSDKWKIQLTIPINIYQIGLEISMMDSDFMFDHFNLLHYKCHKNKSKTWRIIYRFSQLAKTPKSRKKLYQ